MHMNSQELREAYGDSHTLDRPKDGETVHPYVENPETEPAHPLDHPGVTERAHHQAWGS
jgi:hypothetical protein